MSIGLDAGDDLNVRPNEGLDRFHIMGDRVEVDFGPR